MHAGFAVLRASSAESEEQSLELLGRYEAHGMGQALGYGADWSHEEDGLLAATCSFYDRQLHAWKYSE